MGWGRSVHICSPPKPRRRRKPGRTWRCWTCGRRWVLIENQHGHMGHEVKVQEWRWRAEVQD